MQIGTIVTSDVVCESKATLIDINFVDVHIIDKALTYYIQNYQGDNFNHLDAAEAISAIFTELHGKL